MSKVLHEEHKRRGDAFYEQGKFGEAVNEYRKACRLRYRDAEAHHKLGLAFYAQGKLEEAILEYRRAIKLKRNHAVAHKNLGDAYYDQGKIGKGISEEAILEKAIVEYNLALKINPRLQDARNSLSRLNKEIKGGDFNEDQQGNVEKQK